MWNNSHPRYTALLITSKTHNDTVYYTFLIPKMSDEEYCNLMLTLIHQTISMLDKMIDKIKRDFLQKVASKSKCTVPAPPQNTIRVIQQHDSQPIPLITSSPAIHLKTSSNPPNPPLLTSNHPLCVTYF